MKTSSSNQLKSHGSPQQNSSKIKPIFKRDVRTWRCHKPSDMSFINKYKPKMFSSVSISSLRSENIGMNGIRNLRKAFTDSKRISSAFFHNSSVNAKQLTYLLSSTNHWKSLNFLSLENRANFEQELIRTLPRVGRCKKLSDFPFPIISTLENVDRKTTTQICHQLKQINKLKNLNLDIPLYQNTTILNLRSPQSLTSLRLDFKNKTLIPHQKLSSFLTKIQRCNLLERLSLSFSREPPIEVSDAEIWTSFFQNTPKSLKELNISLFFSADQQPEGIQAFIESLKYLRSITAFTLSSFNSFAFNQPLRFVEGYFQLVFTTLQCLTQLEKLQLRFYSFEKKIEDSDIQHLTSMLQCLKNLKKLEIDLPPFQCPDKNLISLAKSLKHLNNLKTLDLSISNNFSQKSMEILSNNIAHLNLTVLDLDFGGYSSSQTFSTRTTIKQKLAKFVCFLKKKENETSAIPFFSDLQNFTQLSTLKLQLSSFDMSNHHTCPFEKFHNLSSLYLTLPQMKNLKGFQKLLSCLKNLPKLAYLDLRFEGKRISDREIEILSSNLAGCQSLLTLGLRFKHAAQLQDKSLYYLQLAIRGLLKLQYLALLFEKEKAFGEKAVSNFLQGLVILKALSRLYFLYNLGSMFRNDSVLLPSNLQGYEDLRNLTHFIVENSRYI